MPTRSPDGSNRPKSNQIGVVFTPKTLQATRCNPVCDLGQQGTQTREPGGNEDVWAPEGNRVPRVLDLKGNWPHLGGWGRGQRSVHKSNRCSKRRTKLGESSKWFGVNFNQDRPNPSRLSSRSKGGLHQPYTTVYGDCCGEGARNVSEVRKSDTLCSSRRGWFMMFVSRLLPLAQPS